ncbi:MAG: type II secretion system protein GspN, partial [Nitrospirota bacterium]
SSLKGNNLLVETEGFKKGLFYSFKSNGIMLKKSNNILLSIENVVGRINPLSLFMMKLTLSFNGNIGGGKIIGEVDLLKRKNQVNISIDSANVDEIPFFAIIGLSGKGVLSGELRFRDRSGDLRFSIKDTRFEGRSFSGVTVPMGIFHNARGAMVINGDTVKVSSFSLEGEGIYARAKGDIRGGFMDLTMEIMRDSSFTGETHIFSMIESYKVSPGYYVIPIKSNISF